MNAHFTSRRLRAALVCAVALSWQSLAQAQDESGGRAQVLSRDSAADRVLSTVYRGMFSYVRIERAEPQAALSQHPVVVAPEVLRTGLAALRNVRVKDDALFNEEELAEIVPPLVRALGEAKPDQDVAFAVSGRHGGWGPLVPRSVTTGRMFRNSDGLQLIVGMVHSPFESQFIATGYLVPFEPGRRAAPFDKSVAIAPASGVARRADWVTLSMVAAPTVAVVAPPAATPPGVAAAPPAATPSGVVAAPAAAAVAPAAPAKARDAAFFEEQEYRLRTLKRLRDSGLISEEEYQKKRTEILDKL